MQYLGSKGRAAKYISKIINEQIERERDEISRWEKPYSKTNSGIYKPSGGGVYSCPYSVEVV